MVFQHDPFPLGHQPSHELRTANCRLPTGRLPTGRRPICLLLLLLVLPGLPQAMDLAERQAAQEELAAISDEVAKLSRAFNLIHEIARPSVVDIHIRTAVLSPFRGIPLREVPVGEGSGFFFHADNEHSYIVTNAHVAVKTDEDQHFLTDRFNQPVPFENIRVQTWDNRIYEAVFLGADIDSDLAVLRIDEGHMPRIDWADSDQARVGDWVVALGFPLGVGYSASSGIISAIDRSTDNNEHNFDSYIQTDAAINPGNSGGPLLNLRGAVIGVNTRIISRTRLNIGLGFAIPANLARRVAEDLRQFGRVYRPMIGFQMRPLQPGEAERFSISNPEGVVVTLSFPGTPAANAGLAAGDVILAVNGLRISGINHLRTLIAAAEIDRPMRLRLWRDGAAQELDVIPRAKEDVLRDLEKQAASFRDRELLLRDYGLTLGNDEHIGVLVKAVQPGSAAAEAGLRQGDRILAVRGYGAVHTMHELASLLRSNPQLICNVYRDGATRFVVLRR
ncbi:MAG: trypsin-like peptidase domain-containing protein [Planctomycetota bacterium]